MGIITAVPLREEDCYRITLEGGRTYSVSSCAVTFVAGTNRVESMTINGATITNENGQLVVTDGDIRLEGEAAERALRRLPGTRLGRLSGNKLVESGVVTSTRSPGMRTLLNKTAICSYARAMAKR